MLTFIVGFCALWWFNGRITCGRWWIYTVVFLASVVTNLLVVANWNFQEKPSPLHVALGFIVVWLTITAQAKRWHDMDESGWNTVLAFSTFPRFLNHIVECGFEPGTDGPNRYGPDPLARQRLADRLSRKLPENERALD